MRQLLPIPDEDRSVDPVAAYLAVDRPRSDGRPWVTMGMIASIDGATAVEGRSGELGGPADQAVLRAVRAIADVVLVGAGTARTERYRPVRCSEEVTAARRAAGRSDGPPRLAVVSGTLGLDPGLPLFADPERRPVVLTTDAAPDDRRTALSEVADVHCVGTDTVDLAAALSVLAEMGAGVVVCEGGPTLNGALLDAGVVDEVCLTVSPTLVGGDSARVATGGRELPVRMALASLLTADDLLFARWIRT